jgi:hypothetical protein
MELQSAWTRMLINGLVAILVFPNAISAQLRVTPQNNVGIGLMNPTEKLEIYGNIRLETAANKLILGDVGRFIGRVGNASDLAIVSRPKDFWLRIGSMGGIAIWAGGGVEDNDIPQSFFDMAGGLTLGGVGAAPYRLKVFGSSFATGAWYSSDSRYKLNIGPIHDPIGKVKQLMGHRYSFDKEKYPMFSTYGDFAYGFIAQEMKESLPEAVATDSAGYMAVNYDMIIPLLVEAMKAQELRIEELEANAAALSKKYTAATSVDERLDQSFPNPTTGTVSIGYFVEPSQKEQITIRLMDLSGKPVKQLDGLNTGEQTITLDVRALPAGEYTYSLIVNNQPVATRKLTISH